MKVIRLRWLVGLVGGNKRDQEEEEDQVPALSHRRCHILVVKPNSYFQLADGWIAHVY
jgi:hypothetical protein